MANILEKEIIMIVPMFYEKYSTTQSLPKVTFDVQIGSSEVEYGSICLVKQDQVWWL